MKARSTFLAAGLCLMLLAACNTVEGVGEDIETTGDVIEDSAEGTKEHLPRSRGYHKY